MADLEWDSKSGLLIGYTLTGNDREGRSVAVTDVQLYAPTIEDLLEFLDSWSLDDEACLLLHRDLGHDLTEDQAATLLRWALRALQERSDVRADEWRWSRDAIAATRRKGGL